MTMTLTKDEEIRTGLKSSGVPEATFYTTLVLENASDLRELIVSRSLLRKGAAKGVYVYPKAKANTTRARKLFYLVAKEMFLTGTTVFCVSLTRLVELLNSEDYFGDAASIDKVRVVFLLDFYEEGAPSPLTPSDAAKVRTWVRQRFEEGNAVSLLSDSPLDRCAPWWPVSFLGFLNENVYTYAV